MMIFLKKKRKKLKTDGLRIIIIFVIPKSCAFYNDDGDDIPRRNGVYYIELLISLQYFGEKVTVY